MPKFGRESKAALQSCHRDLVLVANFAIQVMDFSVLEGHRGKKRQNRLYQEGKTKVRYPDSKHNSEPSNAFDVAPYPIDWEDAGRFRTLAGVMFASAHILRKMGAIDSHLRWGGDWDMDGHQDDNKFDDLGHFERVKK